MDKRVLIIASKLGREGTSRFVTYLANYLSNDKSVGVELLFFRDVDEELLDRFDSKIKITSLNVKSKLWLNFYTIISKIIRTRPNYCLLAYHQLLWIGFWAPLFHLFGIKLYMRDTIIPTLFHERDNAIKKRITVWAYRCYDLIIAQSRDMLSDLVEHWGCKREKIELINNPIDVDLMLSEKKECPAELRNKTVFTFVAAGRLEDQKGYDMIIERMSEIKDSLSFQLLILGSGSLEVSLKNKISELKMDNYIKLLGFKKDVLSYLMFSDALLLSSRYEGFPNIVLEAQAIGKPVFSNNCLGGINEILENEETGVSCDFSDRTNFSRGLNRFFSNRYNKESIIEKTRQRYDLPHIMKRYMTIFKK